MVKTHCPSTTVAYSKLEMKKRITMIAKKPKTLIFTLIIVGIIIMAAASCTFTGAGKSMNNEIDIKTYKEASEVNLLQKLESALPDGGIIADSYIDDFGKDNKLEMFALVNIGKEGEEGISDSQVWYTDESSTKMMLEGGIYQHTATIWDAGNRKLFYVEEGYGGSGSLSHVWSVKEGSPYELKHAGQLLEYAGDLQFYTYPSAFDLMPDGTGGHTWKRYYLYLDEETGTFKEYGGILISKEDLLKLKGASEILDEMNKKSCKITDIFYRGNGIININYHDGEHNLTITLTIQDGTVSIVDLNSIKNPDLDQGGIYKAAVYEDIATYPEKFDY